MSFNLIDVVFDEPRSNIIIKKNYVRLLLNRERETNEQYNKEKKSQVKKEKDL